MAMESRPTSTARDVPAKPDRAGGAAVGRVRIVDVATVDPPSFNALHDDRRFVIMLDGSAVMELCGSDSFAHLNRHLMTRAGRVATAAERILAGRHELPPRLTISALDFD